MDVQGGKKSCCKYFSFKDEERYGLWRRIIQWRRIATDNGNHAKLFNASFASIIIKKVSSKQIVIIIDTYD